jgi:hypothetical protein
LCIIGGIAVLRWGEPRFTRDIHVALHPDAADFARRNRVLLLNLLNSPQGVPIDIALGGLPFEALAVDRSSLFTFAPGCALLFSFRTRDVLDVETVVVRQQGRLDWDYIDAQLRPLAKIKDQPEIMAALLRLKQSDAGNYRL